MSQQRPQMAKLDDVAQFTARLPDDFLACRTWAHSWDLATSAVRRASGHIHWSVECATCGTIRTLIMTSSGRIAGNRYDYPDGYQSTGLGRIGQSGRALFRMATLKRVRGA